MGGDGWEDEGEGRRERGDKMKRGKKVGYLSDALRHGSTLLAMCEGERLLVVLDL